MTRYFIRDIDILQPRHSLDWAKPCYRIQSTTGEPEQVTQQPITRGKRIDKAPRNRASNVEPCCRWSCNGCAKQVDILYDPVRFPLCQFFQCVKDGSSAETEPDQRYRTDASVSADEHVGQHLTGMPRSIEGV